jgi:hypothetical protein
LKKEAGKVHRLADLCEYFNYVSPEIIPIHHRFGPRLSLMKSNPPSFHHLPQVRGQYSPALYNHACSNVNRSKKAEKSLGCQTEDQKQMESTKA